MSAAKISAGNAILIPYAGGRDMRKKVSIILVILIFAVALLYLSFDRIAIFIFAKTYSLDISYKNLNRISLSGFTARDLMVTDKKSGIGIFSKSASVKPVITIGLVGVDFDLKDVNFVKKKREGMPSYDSIDNLVSAPFSSNWKYGEISGSIEETKGVIKVRDLEAKSDEIRLSLSGSLYQNNNIDSRITVSFAETLTRKIPKELSEMVLRDETGGWKSFSVNLAGNYKSPAIQVSGKLFRLNIREKIVEKQ